MQIDLLHCPSSTEIFQVQVYAQIFFNDILKINLISGEQSSATDLTSWRSLLRTELGSR